VSAGGAAWLQEDRVPVRGQRWFGRSLRGAGAGGACHHHSATEHPSLCG